MSDLPSYLRGDGHGGTILVVRAAPGAKRSGIAGEYGGALKVRVAAPAVDGKANRALIAFLAASLGVPRRAIELQHGAGGRSKLLRIEDLTPQEAARRIRANI